MNLKLFFLLGFLQLSWCSFGSSSLLDANNQQLPINFFSFVQESNFIKAEAYLLKDLELSVNEYEGLSLFPHSIFEHDKQLLRKLLGETFENLTNRQRELIPKKAKETFFLYVLYCMQNIQKNMWHVSIAPQKWRDLFVWMWGNYLDSGRNQASARNKAFLLACKGFLAVLPDSTIAAPSPLQFFARAGTEKMLVSINCVLNLFKTQGAFNKDFIKNLVSDISDLIEQAGTIANSTNQNRDVGSTELDIETLELFHRYPLRAVKGWLGCDRQFFERLQAVNPDHELALFFDYFSRCLSSC